MAKLGLLFLVIFVAIQLTLGASRMPRDADESTKVAEDADPMKAAGALFESAKKALGEVFTQENVDSAVGSLSALGEKMKQAGTELANSLKKASVEGAAAEGN